MKTVVVPVIDPAKTDAILQRAAMGVRARRMVWSAPPILVLLLAGCGRGESCNYAISSDEEHSGIAQRYVVSVEAGLEERSAASGPAITVHVIHADLVERGPRRGATRIFYAIEGSTDQLLGARVCEGDVSACSGQIVALANATCGAQ